MTGLLCPTCDGPNHAVTKTDAYGEFVRRQRQCADCAREFTTYEAAGRAGGRFMRAVHLHRAMMAMTPIRRKIVENLIEELAPVAAARVNLGGDE